MRKIISVLLIGMLVILSCRESPGSVVVKPGSRLNNPQQNVVITRKWNGCYRMIIEKDTAYLQLDQEGNQVKGPLIYQRAEKDKNKGVFKGELMDNIIKGWYEFDSEGTVSVREMSFLTAGNGLAEGYGDIELKGDTAIYRFPFSLKYEMNHPFIPIDCDSIQTAFISR